MLMKPNNCHLHFWKRRLFLPTLLLVVLSAASWSHAKIPLNADGLPSLAPMLKKAVPAVVNISVRGNRQAANPLFNDPFFRRFFGGPPAEREFSGSGSGVVIDADAGLVLSNHHVIDKAAEIRVTLADGREFDAELLGSDPATDVALLRVPAEALTAMPMGDSESLEVGDFVVAIGNPFGFRQTVTMGIVSAKGRSGLGRGFQDYIQTDASINPGNSGGALINLRGELVGINTAIYSQSGGNIGIGFAIPVQLVSRVMKQLQQYGEVQRGLLGIVGQDMNAQLATAFGLRSTNGVIITRVTEGSPAQAAGLRSEDILLRLNGESIADLESLRNRIGLLHVGDTFSLQIWRDGRKKKVKATLTRPEMLTLSGVDVHPLLKGVEFEEDPIRSDPIAVTAVKRRSKAWKAGLRPGDQLLSVNRASVNQLRQLPRVISRRQRRLGLEIYRSGADGGRGERYLVIIE